MTFTSLGLPNKLIKALTEKNITTPFPIQEKAIPAILDKKDVLGIAKTGSGKTASYVLPILCNLSKQESSKNRHINTLVLVPTRELAIQVDSVFKEFSSCFADRKKSLAVYGGVSINPQMISLQGVEILIATPGRLIELCESNAIHLSQLSTLVLDEADKMLNLGFKDEMSKILSLLPTKRQNLLFSASLSDNISDIKNITLSNPEVINIKSSDEEEEDVDKIEQTVYLVKESNKGPLLRYLIKHEEIKQVLIFASSIFKADSIATKLRKNGIETSVIHGKKSQNSRIESLRRFKEKTVDILVATDLLSRGIDIEQLECVVNYELPRSPKDFLHRIGRTGRSEHYGKAITFVSEEEHKHFKIIQKKLGFHTEFINGDNINTQNF